MMFAQRAHCCCRAMRLGMACLLRRCMPPLPALPPPLPPCAAAGARLPLRQPAHPRAPRQRRRGHSILGRARVFFLHGAGGVVPHVARQPGALLPRQAGSALLLFSADGAAGRLMHRPLGDGCVTPPCASPAAQPGPAASVPTVLHCPPTPCLPPPVLFPPPADNAAKVYGVLRATPWAPHIKFVIVTAEGHAAPQMNYDVMQPLLRQRVETWADFSARLPARQVRRRERKRAGVEYGQERPGGSMGGRVGPGPAAAAGEHTR